MVIKGDARSLDNGSYDYFCRGGVTGLQIPLYLQPACRMVLPTALGVTTAKRQVVMNPKGWWVGGFGFRASQTRSSQPYTSSF